MTSEVERFVRQAVAERSAVVLLAAPEAVGRRLLCEWVEELGARQRAHAIAIVAEESPWAEVASGSLYLSVVVCGPELTPDQVLRSALRQDPDIILSERAAAPPAALLLAAAETGHQVLAHLPGDLEQVEQAAPYPLGLIVHLGVEADEQGIARLVRFADRDLPREVLWDRDRADPLPAELPGRAPPPPPPLPPAPEPLPAETIEAARAALADRLLPTWLPVLAEPSDDAACSKLGGRPMLAAGEAWPSCPNCALALPLALQLRREDLPAPAAERFPSGAGWLQLFYCDSVDCSCEDPAAPAAQNRLLRWLPAADAVPAGAPPTPLGDEEDRSWTAADLRGFEERREGPHSEDLADLDEESRDACQAVREQRGARFHAREAGVELQPELTSDEELGALGGARSGDKLLGWPCWEQGPEWSPCPRCGARRELLFQLDAWRGHLKMLFAADGRGHVTACLEHPEQLAFAWGCG
ncbi:MAG: ATPase, T2SS/T4P/T4SS family [Planctomycetota bacterium]